MARPPVPHLPPGGFRTRSQKNRVHYLPLHHLYNILLNSHLKLRSGNPNEVRSKKVNMGGGISSPRGSQESISWLLRSDQATQVLRLELLLRIPSEYVSSSHSRTGPYDGNRGADIHGYVRRHHERAQRAGPYHG